LDSDPAIFWAWSGRILHGEITGSQPFFFGPLYAYGLAIARLLSPSSVELILLIQYVLGSVSVVLIADAVRRLVSLRAAIAVGVLLALNPMLVFFDSLVLMEGLLIFVQALLLWIVVRSDQRLMGWKRTILAGALVGTLAQGRAIYGLLLVPLMIHLVRIAETRRDRIRASLALAAGAAAIMSLSLIHNVRAGGEWIPFTYSFGYNLYVGNHPNASGTFSTITGTSDSRVDATGRELNWSNADGRAYIEAETGRRLTPQQSSSYWTSRSAEYVRHDPMAAALGLGKRVLMLWNRHEYPQVENIDEYRMICGPLGLPILGGFGFLAILGLIGISAAWNSGAVAEWLIMNLAVLTLGTALFFVTDRYRLQLIPSTAALAGWGMERVIVALGARRVPRSVWTGLVTGLVIVFAPLPYLRGARYKWEMNGDLGSRWLGRDPNRSIEFFSAALALERSGKIAWRDDDEDRLERAILYHDYARALRQVGEMAKAADFEKRAVALAPQSKVIRSAVSATSTGSSGAGELTKRAWAAARRNEFALAESLFSRSVASDPRQPDAWAALIRLRIQRADTSGARQALERATESGLAGPSLLLHRALVCAAEGDDSTARDLLSKVPEADASDPMLQSVRQAVLRLMHRPA
jgi:4-amino-4-deoxy-L-arabinose transferase-like glycosyltransferase